MSASGTIATIAGDGFAGYTGDGGAATAASLDGPFSAAPLPGGDLLIADGDNGAIREVTLPAVSTISLIPATANEQNGWYSSVQAVITNNEGPVISDIEGAAITSNDGVLENCELDPAQAPPAFAAMLAGCGFTTATPVTGNGVHVLYTASQNVFGDDELPVSQTIKIDTTPPTITCGAPPSFTYGTPGATLSAGIADTVSGVPSPSISAPVSTAVLGERTAILSGANNAGLTSSATCDYRIVPQSFSPPPAVTWSFYVAGSATTVLKLVADHVPERATVTIDCSGMKCPLRKRIGARPRRCATRRCLSTLREVNLAGLFKGKTLHAADRLAVTVTAPGTIGESIIFSFRAGHAPRSSLACLAPGSRQ